MSDKKQPAPDPAIWHLSASTAQLHTSQLRGQIDLDNPLRGLHKLTCDVTALEGSVLGVAAFDKAVAKGTSVDESFVRGNDLVAIYRSADNRPFSLQVYWTVTPREDGIILVDALLSLETRLLECFPRVLVKTELRCNEIWTVPSHAEPSRLDAQASGQPTQGSDCFVLRSAASQWSYAEMAHPADVGDWHMERPTEGKCVVQRELGGAFLEKGVVRRLRIRGAFLPRHEDLKRASQCLAELAKEAPPLTA